MLFKQRYSSAALQIKININSLRMEHGTLAIIFLQIPFHLNMQAKLIEWLSLASVCLFNVIQLNDRGILEYTLSIFFPGATNL
ncbi:hypothetical protein T07_2322 [Trichinella nelsoni]|uniref:Uncharacterized protein n=1 Tax=Trichinella nelsoni TaxID=6336 RepID=A0A0V0SA46_9BILA|nr:hypothetical protein T07_2322 [Trichinella nelsoni]